jgi:ketosteroid isomerase-like protein
MTAPEPHDPVAVARRYFEALAASDRAALESLLAPDIVQEELPNRLNPRGAVRDRAALLESFERGKTLLASQRFEIERSVVEAETAALEVVWTGTLALALGSLGEGATMRARFAVFLEMRDGRIVRQRNYDCFDEFGRDPGPSVPPAP